MENFRNIFFENGFSYSVYKEFSKTNLKIFKILNVNPDIRCKLIEKTHYNPFPDPRTKGLYT